MVVYDKFIEQVKANKKGFAVLIDPDKFSENELSKTLEISIKSKVDYFFVGGSLLTRDTFQQTIKFLKANSDIPVVIFPGNSLQISNSADAILFLSLISGRNPELLIGRHVITAPFLKASGLETIPTGYILIDSGKPTTVLYMSNTMPIPHDKPDIAACTALAGEMLGLKLMFMDAGSGANQTISQEMIRMVKDCIQVPLIVGGGIRSAEQAKAICKAGADIIVVGNALENNSEVIAAIADAVHSV